MIRAHVLLTLAFAALPACQSAHESAAAPAHDPTGETSAATVDLRPSSRPKTDLASAIATAQATAPEARFLGAEFLAEADKPIFRVLLVGEGVVHAIEIDPADGKILHSEDQKLDEESRALIEEIKKEPATIGIDKAIGAAIEQLPLSWASWAGPAHDGEHSCYGVVVINESATKYVLVSAQDGKVLSVRDPEEDDEGEEGMKESKEKEKEEAPPEKPK